VLRPRIIPCLLVSDGGLVKTQRFKDPKYVGDPINAVKIFNEKEADELVVLDIDATVQNREPDFTMIGHLAVECRMPLCYGGGITNREQAKRIIGLGVEKVAISAAAIGSPDLITQIADEIGSQSVVVVLDVKKPAFGRDVEVHTHNGKRRVRAALPDLVREIEQRGAGELVINSIDRDGMMKGYDLDLAERMRQMTRLPVTVLGGAGSLDDIGALIDRCGIIGAAAGSLFVFKGAYRAVLINYPNPARKDEIVLKNLHNPQ
jgi:cyclase